MLAVDVDEARLRACGDDLDLVAGGVIATTVADVSQSAACRSLVDRAVELRGGLHIVANVAAVGQFGATVETIEEDEWDRVLAINLKSVYLMCRFSIPHIRSAGGGVILNVASPHACATTVGVAAYAASKGGVVALSRQMALDFARDRIRVVPVIPGAVDTPMLRSHADRQGTTLEALGFHSDPAVPGRIGSTEEMARVLLWLASDEASYVTGSPIIADGGLLARL